MLISSKSLSGATVTALGKALWNILLVKLFKPISALSVLLLSEQHDFIEGSQIMASFRCMTAVFVAVFGFSAMLVDASPAAAAEKKRSRVGGYSYSQSDTINTYGDSRGRYGSALSLRDPHLGRQTEGGPFDHGFFFDSGVTRHGGDSPYMR